MQQNAHHSVAHNNVMQPTASCLGVASLLVKARGHLYRHKLYPRVRTLSIVGAGMTHDSAQHRHTSQLNRAERQLKASSFTVGDGAGMISNAIAS